MRREELKELERILKALANIPQRQEASRLVAVRPCGALDAIDAVPGEP